MFVLLLACNQPIQCGKLEEWSGCEAPDPVQCMLDAQEACVPAELIADGGLRYGIDADCEITLSICVGDVCSDPSPCGEDCPELTDPGQPEIALSPNGIGWGEVPVGESVSTVVTITNDGFDPLEVTDIRSGDPIAPIELTDPPTAAIPACASADFVVTYTPDLPESLQVTVYVDSNDPELPHAELPLTGEGI